jgi:hypothetical protein
LDFQPNLPVVSLFYAFHYICTVAGFRLVSLLFWIGITFAKLLFKTGIVIAKPPPGLGRFFPWKT